MCPSAQCAFACNVRVHLKCPCIFYAFRCAYVCVRMHFALLKPPLFDVNYLSWKGNVRAQEPQCCSHLCPLMIGQRLSRPNHECLCHGIHTQSCTQEEIFSMTFYCGEWTVQTTPTAFVGCSSDALLLRGWMDGCQAEVNASPLSITHLLL